jgi:hypothetical protein
MIPFSSVNRNILLVNYSLAVLASMPTSLLLNTSFLTLFDRDTYRKLLSYRGVFGSVASITAQLLMIIVLALMTTSYKYVLLYMTAFLVGLIASILLLFTGSIRVKGFVEARGGEEVMVKAVNIYLMILLLFTSANLLSIVWTPWLMNRLHTPD